MPGMLFKKFLSIFFSSRNFFCVVLLLNFFPARSQVDTLAFFEPSKEYNPKRVRLIKYSAAGLYGITMIGLYNLWYRQYPQEHFHFFSDVDEWQQMDKDGH